MIYGSHFRKYPYSYPFQFLDEAKPKRTKPNAHENKSQPRGACSRHTPDTARHMDTGAVSIGGFQIKYKPPKTTTDHITPRPRMMWSEFFRRSDADEAYLSSPEP
jgi:hypothetical protein